jgi:hypothetical protein
MTVAEQLERSRADALAEGALKKYPQLVHVRLDELYRSLSDVEKQQADQVFVSWLTSEDPGVWHTGLNMVLRLRIAAAVPVLLEVSERYSRDTAPGSPDWAETFRNAAWSLSSRDDLPG